MEQTRNKARNSKNLVYDTADVALTQPLSPQAHRLSEASRFLSEQGTGHSQEETRDRHGKPKKSKALSPVQQYKAQNQLERHSMFKHKDFITYSPSQLSAGKDNMMTRQQRGSGVLDRLRVSQQMLESREQKLKIAVLSSNLLENDGDHGMGLLKRK